MASRAEIELVVDASDALEDLERQLTEIVRSAEASADTIDLEAALNTDNSLSELISDLNDVVALAGAAGDTIAVDAALDSIAALSELQDDLDDLVHEAELDAEAIQLDAELDADLAQLDAELAALVEELEDSAPAVELEVEVDRDGAGRRALGRLGSALSGIIGPLGKVAGGIGAAGLAAGASAPLIASVASAVAQIAPAAALAVSGLLTIQLASGTLKLAMVGVGEAIQTAFDPEAKPEDLAKAMKGLTPAAREFVVELRSMKDRFKEIQQDVQENFFQGFAKAAERLSTTALPLVGDALQQVSFQLNGMALGAAEAAAQLAENGTLGKALGSSVKGLENLSGIPGRVVRGLGQIAAAAGPSFERVTDAVGAAVDKITVKLDRAVTSGGLETAIDGAVDAIAQLGRIAGNVFGGLGNIISTVSAEGGGLFATLEKVTQAFEDVTADNGFQQALKALAQTAGVLVATVLPLITQALSALGPVFQALGPPIQILVRALGDGLSKIIAALGPVLTSLALAFGQLVIAVTPLINVAATLIAAILPILTPLFNALGQALNTLVPFIEQVAEVLIATLVPVFNTLATEVLPKILPPFIELSTKIIPVLTSVLVALAPSLVTLAETFANLLVALTPVIVELLNLGLAFADELLPVIQPIIDIILKLVNSALGVLAAQISGLIIPILRILVDFLKGDFDAAWKGVENLIRNIKDKIVEIIISMKDQAVANLSALARAAGEKAREMAQALVDRVRTGVEDVVADLSKLPQRAASALGNAGTALAQAGRDLVQGFINGITEKLGALRAKAQEIAEAAAGTVKNFLGIQSPSKLMMEVGNDTMDGFTMGIAEKIPDLRRELQGVAALTPSFALPGGQTLRLPDLGQRSAPAVQVFIGNEQFNGHIDARVTQNEQARDLLVTRGVRR